MLTNFNMGKERGKSGLTVNIPLQIKNLVLNYLPKKKKFFIMEKEAFSFVCGRELPFVK